MRKINGAVIEEVDEVGEGPQERNTSLLVKAACNVFLVREGLAVGRHFSQRNNAEAQECQARKQRRTHAPT